MGKTLRLSTLLLVLLTTSVASAVTLTPVDDYRLVLAGLTYCHSEGGPEVCDNSVDQQVASPFEPFHATADAPLAPGMVVTTQDSSISSSELHSTSTVNLSITDLRYTGGGTSLYGIKFTLDDAAHLSLTAELEFALQFTPSLPDFGNGATVSLFLCPVDCEHNHGDLFVNQSISSYLLVDHGSVAIQFDQILPAGQYDLEVQAYITQETVEPDFGTGTASWAADLTVPEPETLALTALAALALGFSRAAARARV